MQEAASRTAEAGEGDGGPDAEFLLEDWDSDGGRPGAKRCACVMVVHMMLVQGGSRLWAAHNSVCWSKCTSAKASCLVSLFPASERSPRCCTPFAIQIWAEAHRVDGLRCRRRLPVGADSSDSEASDASANGLAAEAMQDASPPRTQVSKLEPRRTSCTTSVAFATAFTNGSRDFGVAREQIAHRRLAGSNFCPMNPHQCFLLVQVIFASRTHSQLSQFVGELQRTPFALSLATVSLASRKVCNISCPALLRLSALCHTTVRLFPCHTQLNLTHNRTMMQAHCRVKSASGIGSTVA